MHLGLDKHGKGPVPARVGRITQVHPATAEVPVGGAHHGREPEIGQRLHEFGGRVLTNVVPRGCHLQHPGAVRQRRNIAIRCLHRRVLRRAPHQTRRDAHAIRLHRRDQQREPPTGVRRAHTRSVHQLLQLRARLRHGGHRPAGRTDANAAFAVGGRAARRPRILRAVPLDRLSDRVSSLGE